MRYAWIFLIIVLVGCQRPSTSPQTVAIDAPIVPVSKVESVTATPTASILTATPLIATPTATTAVSPTETPFFSGTPSPQCGQILPILAENDVPLDTLTVDPVALENLRAIVPDNAWAAVQQMLEQPETVGLALYQMGDEANGVYLNANQQMPIASVAKVITLVAYAEAVDRGELNPATAVSLDTLDQYYLPGYDLGSHARALRELEENGRLLNSGTAVTLEDVAWMMIRHSSNASADYLHRLLGQQRIEETAVSLDLASQTAPCTFLGQFLAMGNHTNAGERGVTGVNDYLNNISLYQQEVELLADAYIADADFRSVEQSWRSRYRDPSVDTQRYFSHTIAPQGTAFEYANLMARLAQNGLASPESSFTARRILEWPMVFETNQEQFTNLGYKNGSLPGILATAYYAYRPDDFAPVVIALFYQDLENRTYRNWRTDLPHDEFARWALADPAAIPALKAVFE